MEKKFLYALTVNVLNTLKKMGIKPQIGVTTKVKRLPGSKNSFNTDLTKLEGVDPEGLKRLIKNDANFLPQATQDELVQYNNNLEYLKSTYPDIFKQPETAINAKTGVKTLVDDVNERLQGKQSMETFDPKTGEVTIPKEPVQQGNIPVTIEGEESIMSPKEIMDKLMGRTPKAKSNITEVIDEGIRKQADMARMGLDPGNPDDYLKYDEIIKNREPKAEGGLMIGIGTMFRKRGR